MKFSESIPDEVIEAWNKSDDKKNRMAAQRKEVESNGVPMPAMKILGDPSSFAGSSEHSQQVALFAAVAQYMESVPELKWLHAVPNGGSRGSDKRSAMISGANMKAEGQKKGVYDLHLPVARCGYHSFYIEMKAPGVIKRNPDGSVRVNPKGMLMDGRSDEQIAFGAFIATEGSLGAVFDSWVDAFRALMWYLGFEHSKAWELPLGG